MENQLVQLYSDLPPLQLIYNNALEPHYKEEPTFKETQWETAVPSNVNNFVWYYSEEIDVSGWGARGLTFFPTGYRVLNAPVYRGLGGGYLVETTIMTQSPFDVINWVQGEIAASNRLDFTFPALLQKRGPFPGSSTPLLDREDFLGGITTMLSTSTQLPAQLAAPVNSVDFSSLEPTATDRIYVYRIITIQNAALQTVGTVEVPACRVVLAGVPSAEKELSYIMRLNNSFKLNQSDVGLI